MTGMIDGPSAPRPEGHNRAERTSRQGGLPFKRKFNAEMWKRWLEEHNRVNAERLIGPI